MKLSYDEVRRRCLKPNMAEKPLYAKHVTHFFSTRLVWMVGENPVNPNHITTLSLVTGLWAASFFWSPTPGRVLCGAVLLELYYVFDAMDGQLARLQKRSSKTGAFYDSIVTYIVQPALYVSIGWGVYYYTLDALDLVAAFVAAFATLWVTLLWHFQAAIFLYFIKRSKGVKIKAAATAPSPAALFAGSPLKSLFTLLQKSLTFPFTMNLLTAIGIAAFVCELLGGYFPLVQALRLYVAYGASAATLIAVVMTTSWITTRKIDSRYASLFEESA